MVDWNRVRERQDEDGAALGDPRRCPRHGEVTSSPDGMFDAPCGRCEMEADRADENPGRQIDCDRCTYSISENCGIRAGDPCPDCEAGTMWPRKYDDEVEAP